MAETDLSIQNNQAAKASTELALRQQGAAYARPWMAVSPTPCDLSSDGFSLSAIRILRLQEVITRVGLRRASIYLHMNKGTFPKSISLGPRAVGWLEHEIDAWLALRIQARAKGGC